MKNTNKTQNPHHVVGFLLFIVDVVIDVLLFYESKKVVANMLMTNQQVPNPANRYRTHRTMFLETVVQYLLQTVVR
ncbi:MAG: hypothetical protein IJD18_00625, partial [Clostridia bacterium]|nr:hypothetical protein [Clostridia bacterium]